MIRQKLKYLNFKYLLLLWIWAALPAWANTTTVPTTSGKIIRNDARITFEWPSPVPFKTSAKGKTVTITFPREVNPNFGQLLSNLYPYVTSAKRKSDGKTIVITMDQPYKIRTFQADAVSGIDILHIDVKRRPDYAAVTNIAKLSPSAGETAETATPPAATTAANDSSARPPNSDNKQLDANAAVAITLSASEDSAVMRFPFKERMSLAVFIRNNIMWVILGKKVSLDLRDFEGAGKSVLGKGEIMPHDTATILRVPVNDGITISVAKEENSFDWAVLLNNLGKPPTNPLKVDINTDPPAPPHVLINALQMSDSITVSDPIIGDEMIVIPMFTLGEGMSNRRDFVDFTLIETAEGAVIVKKSDDVAVTSMRNGLRISLPQGATLTPGLPQIEKAITPEALQKVPTLFPYAKWSLPPELPERAVIREMITKIMTAPGVAPANDHRLKLAQVYLGIGMAEEAIVMLEGIKRTDKNFYRSSKLAALRGAANFLMQRYTEASRDFASSELNNNKEVNYWRNMLADLQGKEASYDYMEMNESYISQYPPVFRQKLAIVAADRAVDTKEYNTAVKIFESLTGAKSPAEDKKSEKHEASDKNPKEEKTAENTNKEKINAQNLQKSELIKPINNYVRFLLAKIAAETGQPEESLKELSALSEDYSDPFVRSRAEYSRIILEMNRDLIKKDQVIERMERLRLSWHGDGLELKVLSFLGDIYSDSKDYVNAMRIWDNAVHAYAGTAQAAELTHKMEETFVRMFNEGTADSLPPLSALALYYQYKGYAPPGSIGREMTANLADRLVNMDLLDQAASLLEHQMRNDTEKSKRSQIGAKVATIYLLNHDPKKALRALQDSVYGENPSSLHQLRNRLAAEALVELNDSDKAWQILAEDDSIDAERIRLRVLWEKRDWPRIVHSVEAILKARKDVAAKITLQESEYVIQLALAYIFENNREQLQYLHDYFTPLMTENPNKDLFEYITAGDITPTATNFDEVIKNLMTTRSFIENYKAQIKTAGLNAVVPNVR